MATISISLPDAIKGWVDQQANNGQFSGVGDYIRDLVGRDQQQKDVDQALLQALREGEQSGPAIARSREELLALARQKLAEGEGR